jgi:hypothetical protein
MPDRTRLTLLAIVGVAAISAIAILAWPSRQDAYSEKQLQTAFARAGMPLDEAVHFGRGGLVAALAPAAEQRKATQTFCVNVNLYASVAALQRYNRNAPRPLPRRRTLHGIDALYATGTAMLLQKKNAEVGVDRRAPCHADIALIERALISLP